MEFTSLHRDKVEEMTALWNSELSEQFPMRAELLVQNSFDDVNVLEEGSCLALNEKGEVIGFVVSKYWQEQVDVEMDRTKGWIQVLLVHSAYRNQGIGTKLLQKAESALKAAGAQQIALGGDPWHYFPALPAEYVESADWFKKRGYVQGGTPYDLLASFEPNNKSAFSEFPGTEFVILQEEEQDKLLEFMHRIFPGRWEYETIQYFKKGGTGREYVVQKKEGEIIGFCRVNDGQSPYIAQNVYWSPLFEGELGGIGPLGIDDAQRGNGYGLAIVEAATAVLRARGIDEIVIDWTVFLDFYGRLGYEAWKEYHVYTKNLLEQT